MNIAENKERVGNFTSSAISALMTSGKVAGTMGAPALTYIQEKNYERKLGRSIDTDSYSKDMAWGIFLEARVERLLEFGYVLDSQTTKVHPSISYWAGSTDVILPGKKIGDIKCYQPKKFAKYADCLLKKDIDFLKKNFPDEYWQLVSNAIINQVPNAEALLYMPYKSELYYIREMADNYDGDDPWKYKFIVDSEDGALANLPDGGYYKNLNRFEFKVPQEDIKALTNRVLEAGEMLIDFA